MTPEIELFLMWINGIGNVDILTSEYKLGVALVAMRDEFDTEIMKRGGH